MATLIQKITRLAINTFKRDHQLSPSGYKTHYDQLCDLLARLTPMDLQLDPALLQDQGLFNPSRDRAPVTYMQIYEDLDLTICVFILKRGVRLPLHDHPGMFGLLKVVHGSVSVQSYSFLTDQEQHGNNGDGRRLGNGSPNLPQHQRLLAATKHPTLVATASDPACRLSPGDNNVHEIHSLDGPAAFLDILSPPYGTDERLGLERDCHYYRELDVSAAGIGGFEAPQGKPTVLLCRVDTPNDFWCDQAEYQGPAVLGEGNNGVNA